MPLPRLRYLFKSGDFVRGTTETEAPFESIGPISNTNQRSFCLFYVSSRSIRADFLIFYGKYEIFDNYCGNRSLPEPYRSPFLLQFCDRRCLVPDLRALSHPNRWSKNIYDNHKLCPKLSVISSVMN